MPPRKDQICTQYAPISNLAHVYFFPLLLSPALVVVATSVTPIGVVVSALALTELLTG